MYEVLPKLTRCRTLHICYNKLITTLEGLTKYACIDFLMQKLYSREALKMWGAATERNKDRRLSLLNNSLWWILRTSNDDSLWRCSLWSAKSSFGKSLSGDTGETGRETPCRVRYLSLSRVLRDPPPWYSRYIALSRVLRDPIPFITCPVAGYLRIRPRIVVLTTPEADLCRRRLRVVVVTSLEDGPLGS